MSSNALEAYPLLQELDLSYNCIHTIENKAFRKSANLTKLDLSHNFINYANQSKEIFFGLERLTALAIQIKDWKSGNSYSDDIFSPLHGLRELHVDGPPGGAPFGVGFTNLTHLEELYIYGGFDVIHNETFVHLQSTKVSVLHIRSRKLYDLEPESFQHFPYLTNLSLSNNIELGLNNMSHGWYGLQFTNITHLYLQHCVQSVYSTTTLSKDFFQFLNETKNLKTIWLDRNNILDIYCGFATHLPHLEAISLNCNRMQTTLYILQDCCSLTNLTYLSLAYQTRTHFGGNCADDSLYMESLAEEGRNTWSSYEDPNCTCPCRRIQPPLDKYPKFLLPNKLGKLIYKGSLIVDGTLSNRTWMCNNRLTYLDYSQNYISNLDGQLQIQCPYTEEEFTLLFDSNVIDYISPNFLKYSIDNGLRIGTLSLFGNRLGMQIKKDVNGSMFRIYSNLKNLNLGSNDIKTIPERAFHYLTSLVSLNLTMNDIRTVNFGFTQMSNLTHFDLSRNLLTSLDEQTMSNLDKLAMRSVHTVTVYLAENPLICACATLDFLKWIQITTITVANYNDYVCRNDLLGDYITLSQFYHNYRNRLETACLSKVYLLAACVSLGACLLVGAITVCIYRHRWDVKFFLLHIRDKYGGQEEDDDAEDVIKYDAFVAYHQDDIVWVRHSLLKALEEPPSGSTRTARENQRYFRLCLHHRDFLPGTPIEENIVESINKSRKIILVLSTSFVTSGWCDFELQMARMRCFDKGRDLIVVVMLEPVAASAMSKTLRALIRRTTYIEWPFSPRHRTNFWDKVRHALQAPEVAPLLCECGRNVRYKTQYSTRT